MDSTISLESVQLGFGILFPTGNAKKVDIMLKFLLTN